MRTSNTQKLCRHALQQSSPLVPLEVAAFLLNREAREVVHLVDTGTLPFAWDIRGPVGRRRSELRIYWRCLEAMLRDTDTIFNEEAVYEDILPPSWPVMQAVDLRRRLSCSDRLVKDIINAHYVVTNGKGTRGRYGSPEVPRESALRFLKLRRVSVKQPSVAPSSVKEESAPA